MKTTPIATATMVKPKTRTRLRRAKPTDASSNNANLASNSPRPEDAGEEDNNNKHKADLAQEILISGNVQSFVDFFYLTHRPDPSAGQSMNPNAEIGPIKVTATEQEFIKENLVEAELSRRKGVTPAVYSAYNNLALYYSSENIADPKTSVYFQEKCLEISKLTGDANGEMSANHALGLVFSQMGDCQSAISYHERHMELAREKQVYAEKELASTALEKVYRVHADNMEEAGDYNAAVEFFSKQLEAARANRDRAAEGEACFRLGRTYVVVQQAVKAIQFLDEYERIAIELEDLTGHGKASAALAAAHQSLGDDDKAVEFLTNYLEISAKTENLQAQGESCSALGVIYNSRGEFDKSVEMFEKNFEIARSNVSSGQANTSLVDKSRVYLGIARGNQLRGKVFMHINTDISELINMKKNPVK